MNCARFETLLSDYMEGVLDPRVRTAMDQHLQSCSECSRLLREVSELREELAHFPEVALREELIGEILERTTGKPRRHDFWHSVVLPAIQPFLTQRYAFATLMIFALLSFAVNVMGPGPSASSYSKFSPSVLLAQADEFGSEVYRIWTEFNDLKSRAREEFRLFREDLIGRLDYHLVTILFDSYEDTVQQQGDQSATQPVEPPDAPAEQSPNPSDTATGETNHE